jgi:hypothetical protein
MNAGTCCGKNKRDPRGRGIEKPREVTLTFFKGLPLPIFHPPACLISTTTATLQGAGS